MLESSVLSAVTSHKLYGHWLRSLGGRFIIIIVCGVSSRREAGSQGGGRSVAPLQSVSRRSVLLGALSA